MDKDAGRYFIDRQRVLRAAGKRRSQPQGEGAQSKRARHHRCIIRNNPRPIFTARGTTDSKDIVLSSAPDRHSILFLAASIGPRFTGSLFVEYADVPAKAFLRAPDDGRMGPRSNNDQKNTTREELLCARSLLQHVLLRFR
jgi:hypothetical protein